MDTEVNRFAEFYRDCYREEIEQLARNYPDKQRGLYIDYESLAEYDSLLAKDYLAGPEWVQESAEQALSKVNHSADVNLDKARVRLRNVPAVTVEPGNIRAQDDIVDTWTNVRGYVKDASDVTPMITEASFECQRCGTLTEIPQKGDNLQKPHKCQECGHNGPFRIEYYSSDGSV